MNADLQLTFSFCLLWQCASHPCFMIHPNLTGLAWNPLLFFNRGKFPNYFLLGERPTNVWVRSHKKKVPETAVLEIRGGQMQFIIADKFSKCVRQIRDFGAHILTQLERGFKLVSENSILRIDLGADFKECEPHMEAELCAQQKRPQQWQTTGEGYIIRLFFDGVHSSLTMDYLSCHTNFPIVQTAADTAA